MSTGNSLILLTLTYKEVQMKKLRFILLSGVLCLAILVPVVWNSNLEARGLQGCWECEMDFSPWCQYNEIGYWNCSQG